MKFQEMSINYKEFRSNLKVGDIVLVDIDYNNGGYEAEIVFKGNAICEIKSEGETWPISIFRLFPKT